jgi:hypothetical protein
MQEYRWLIRNSSAAAISADRGRFLNDNDAIASAELLLKQTPAAAVLEVWRGSKLISRTERDAAQTSSRDNRDPGNC